MGRSRNEGCLVQCYCVTLGGQCYCGSLMDSLQPAAVHLPFHYASFLLLPGKAAAMTVQRAAQFPLPSTKGSDHPLSQDGLLSSYYLCVRLPPSELSDSS